MLLRRSSLLAAAFAALLVISAIAAWAVWWNTRTAQANEQTLYQHDLAVEDTLSDLRSRVYLNAILVRDSLLEREGNLADRQLEMNEIQSRMRSDLSALEHYLSAPEAKMSLARLTSEVEDYNRNTEDVLKMAPRAREQLRDEILRTRSGLRREILLLTESIEMVAEKNSEQERSLMEASNSAFRASLGWIAGIALLLGAAVTILTWTRLAALESASEAAQTELRSLSGQLRTAQEQERKYLSRELHDQVGQMLTGLRLELTALGRHANVDLDVRQSLDRAKSTVEQTLGIIRNIAMLLRPSMLDDLGLTPALTWLVKEVSRTSGIEIHKEIDDRVDSLPDAHRTCLYRVVQEALTNASRHSGARNVELQVDATDSWVHVLVKDDGRGFEGAQKKRGIGLVGMEERVRELGGQVQLTSIPGRGTSVEIRLPKPAAREDSNGESTDRGRPRHRTNGVTASV